MKTTLHIGWTLGDIGNFSDREQHKCKTSHSPAKEPLGFLPITAREFRTSDIAFGTPRSIIVMLGGVLFFAETL
ncbi:MAG: hypothetical protein IJS96_01600 [Schwartzia sp.]|nr:hypothetical protein [Schwartzia sp. (in: firmicutes)]